MIVTAAAAGGREPTLRMWGGQSSHVGNVGNMINESPQDTPAMWGK